MASGNPAAGRYPIAAAALALLIAGVFMPSPLYEYYRAHWGLTPGEISIVFAIYAGSLIPTLLFFGGVSDELGRRKTLTIAIGIAALAALTLACASNLWALLAGRVLQGVAIGIGTPTATAAIREWIAPGIENRVGIVAMVAIAIGSAFGALLAGLLAEYAPLPTVSAFIVYIVLAAIMVLVVRTVPSCPHCVSAWHRGLPSIPPRIRRPFFVAAAQSFVGWSVIAIFASLVPSFLEAALGVHNLIVGSFVICFIQVGALLAAYVSGHLNNRTAILAALLTLGVGLWTLLLAVPHNALVLLALGVAIAGFGNGLGYVAGLNIVTAIAPPEHRAETLSALFVASYLGFSIPALAVGLAANHVGLYVAIIGAAVALGVAAVVIMLATTQHNLEASL
ncbi:MAG TPA: MFS transporter [Candidatus Baltobacteraceae bacterium]|nr:MFS transporter [Candidatus Baltobacteraceae bacterium]